MLLNLSTILKISLFLIFISLSGFFLFQGYQDLKIIKFVNLTNIINNKKSNLEEINIDYDKLYTQQSLFEKKLNIENIDIVEKEIIIIVKKNDTFSKLINPYVKNNQIKQQLIDLINNKFDLKKLNVGQKIFLYVSDSDQKNKITKIIIPLNFNTDLVFKKNDEDAKYSVNTINLEIKNELVAKKYSISNSLYEDGRKANVPLTILAEVIKLYSFDIDFQRDIRKDNKLEIMYEILHNENRSTISYGKIQYSNLIMYKNNVEYFHFITSEGFSDYFNKKGKNVRKTLMKTPLDGARLSSSYGMRKHPILGYNTKHLGVDFSAPKGTPVYAAGNGIIEYAGRNGAYGKYIRIRHNSSYKTAYAHLSAFNKGISNGARVNQGQTIGYIGSTGRSTGPHLHYEVMYQGKRINPMKMKLPSRKILKDKELARFINSSKEIYSNFLFNLYE